MRWFLLSSQAQLSSTALGTSLFCGDELVFLYLGGYVFLIWSLAVLTNFLVWGGLGASGFAGFVSQLQRSRLRWPTIVVLFSLAGLPPFFFFGCKLGLLSALLLSGSWVLAAVVALLILLSWAVYFSITRRLFSPLNIDAGLPLWLGRCSTTMALFVVSLLLLLGVGLFFIDDGCLLLTWLLVS